MNLKPLDSIWNSSLRGLNYFFVVKINLLRSIPYGIYMGSDQKMSRGDPFTFFVGVVFRSHLLTSTATAIRS